MVVELERIVNLLLSYLEDQPIYRNGAEVVIKNIEKYFHDERTASEIDFALSLLLKNEDSLLYFIVQATCSNYAKKYFNAILKSLDLVLFLIERHVYCAEKYAANIKKTCMVITQAKIMSADCRHKAYCVLIALFSAKGTLKKTLFPHDEVKQFLEKLLQELCNSSKHTPKVLQKIYELWGTLGEHYGTVVSPKAGQVLNNIAKKLQSQTGGREEVSLSLLTGCVVGLSGLLVNFNPDGGVEHEDICSIPGQRKHSVTIYECLTKLCVYDPEHTRKLAHRAALDLLTRHMSLFWDLMFPQYRWWHATLKVWIEKQGDDRKAGLRVLARFHQEVADRLSNLQEEKHKEAFQYFVKYYKDTLEEANTTSQELTLAIQGFGNLSRACSKLMTSADVEVMFSLVLYRVQQTFMRIESEKEKLENLSDFIESLSNIIREIENISESQLISLEKLCILAIGRYPSVPPQHQPNIVRALKTSIINVATIKGNKLDMFLTTVVYQGVIRTCSHVGVGVQGIELIDEEVIANVITYKSYLPLWKSLLRFADDKKLAARSSASPDLMANVAAKVYNAIVTTLINLIDKLDVSTKPKSQEIELKENNDTSWDSDSSIEASSVADNTIMLNLADLYSELLLPASPNLTAWLSKLMYDIINKAVSFPIIASFYKLLAVVLRCADQLKYFLCGYGDDVGEVEWINQYIVKFLEDVLIKLRQYKGDLQVSCLQAVMATPVVVLEPLLELIAPTLKVVFNVGRSYLELAHKGMDALERWQKELPSEKLNMILQDILPSFDPFLRSGVYFEDASDKDNIHVPRSQMRRQKRLAEESELTKLQKRMLEFISHLNTPTCMSLLDQEQISAVAWSSDKFLQVAIPFPDIRPEIFLDDFLPRVVELALSSERATRSAAGELLHAIVMVLLAKGLEVERTCSESLVQVFKHIAPALLQLGSHPDLLTSQLFRPLIKQMTHWLSSKWMLKSSQTAVLLEAIWDGLTHPTDTAVRDFSAVCMKEFVTWSIKQLTELDLKQHPLNVKAVVKQINTYCLHPSPYKRFGAALAFNNLYQVLREQESLIEIFWLELVYHFLRNLALTRTEDTQKILLALEHLERVLRAKSALFNKESKRRRVPLELKGPLLKDLLNWLIEQCVSTHNTYRKKCMQLVENLACCIPECTMVNEYLQGSHMVSGDYGAGLGRYFLSLAPLSSNNVTISAVLLFLKKLLSSLDCYAWMVGQGLKPEVNLLAAGKSSFFDATKWLLSISLSSATPVLESLRGEQFQCNVLSAQEEAEYTVLKCKALVQLFQFVSHEACIKDLPDEFWSAQWWNVISSCVLTPNKVGFGINNQDLVSKLPELMCHLLRRLNTTLKSSHLQDLYSALDGTETAGCETVCSNLKGIFNGEQNVTAEMKNQLQGLVVLHQCGVFTHLEMAHDWKGETIIKAIADEITDSSDMTVEPNLVALNYMKSLLNFAFSLHKDVTLTLECVLDSKPLKDCKTMCAVTKGEHFTKLFESQLLDHLIDDPSLQCIDHLLSEVDLYKVDFVMKLVKHCEYVPSNVNRDGRNLVAKLSQQWHQLERWAEGNLTFQNKLLDIATCASKCFRNRNACFKSDRMKLLGKWVLSQIAAPATKLPLRYKIDILSLLPCVAQQDVVDDAELVCALKSLRSAHFPQSYSEFTESSLEANTYQIAFQQLLTTLIESGNIDILLTIISETRTDEDHPCKEDVLKTVSSFIKKLSLQNQVRALNKVFDEFKGTANSDGGLVILHSFLIPLVKAALPSAVVTFYATNIVWILKQLQESLEKRQRHRITAENQLKSKIGALALTEALFGTLDVKEYLAADSAIVLASGVIEDKKLSKDLLKLAYGVRTAVKHFTADTYEELFRLYQCAAFKAVISIVTNLDWPNLNVYHVFIFEEKSTHNIWSHIIPTNIRYSFPIDFVELPKRKKQLIEIKTKMEESNSMERSSIFASQTLFTSTLSEDITKYDFNKYSVRSYTDSEIPMEAENSRTNVVVELDVDILNKHECMPTLCGLINHMVHSGKFPPPEPEQEVKLPSWMECLKRSLESKSQHNNVKVFILKLILNCELCFRPYAKFWLSPIIQCMVDQCLGDSINYMTADIIVMLTNWYEVTKLERTQLEKLQVKSFLEFLMEKGLAERKDIFKYNLNLISWVLVVWKPEVPYELLLQMITPHNGTKEQREQQTVQIAFTIAVNLLSQESLPYNEYGKDGFFKALKINMKDSNRTIYVPCADILGRLFKKLDKDNGDFFNEDMMFYIEVCDILRANIGNHHSSPEYNLNRFVLSLHAIQIHYPPISARFLANCRDLVPTLPANSRVLILEILLNSLSFDWETNPYDHLVQCVFNNFLKIDDLNTQEITLKIILKLIPTINVLQADCLVSDVINMSESSKGRCRDVIYDIVASHYNRRVATGDDTSHMVNKCRDVLIRGLVDSDADLQNKIYRFWNEEGRLSSTTCDRVVNVMSTLYSPKEEHHFLSTAVCLLLESAASNPYCIESKVFSHPLTNCTYEEYNVSTNWRAQHSSLVPMFAQTLSSYVATIATQSDRSFNVKATPSSFAFTPTVKSENDDMDTNYTFPTPGTSSTFLATRRSNTYADQMSSRTSSGSKVGLFVEPRRKRFIHSKDQISKQFADKNIQQSVKREKMMSERRKKRDAQVEIIRSYRIGDFPDVEIKYIDIVKPMQLLVKRDSVIARQVFVSLYGGLKSQSVSLPSLPSALHHILQTTTQYEPSTIATVLDVVLTRPEEFTLNLDTLTKVCKNSKLLSMGSMLMEHLLLARNTSPTPAKKSKPSPFQERNNNLWIQLAEMYRCMGEADIVKGIFEEKMVSECSTLVQEALHWESIGCWKKAGEKYKAALSNARGAVMKDFLYEACFKCCEYMSDWKTLNTGIRNQVDDGDLNEIWCDSWTLDHFLPWLFTSEIKIPLIEDTIPNTDFKETVHQWMSDPVKEDHMKSRLGESLCMIYLLSGDEERCRLYSDNNLSQFLDNWAQLDVLQRKLRAEKLLQLQTMMEIHHFMALPSERLQLNAKVTELLHHWSNNSPSILDALNNWETRALYRHFFASKLEERMIGENKIALKDAQLNSQMSLLDCAIQQGNFYVARKYIGFSNSQVTGSEKDENFRLRFSKVKFLQARLEDTNTKVFEMSINAAHDLRNVVKKLSSLSPSLQIKINNQVAVLCDFMKSIVQKDPTVISQLNHDPMYNFRDFIGVKEVARTEDIIARLHEKALWSLQKAVEVAEETTTEGSSPTQLAETYFELAKFSSQGVDINETIMIEALLKAMKFGSSEARQLFPNLLQLASLSSSNAQLFIDESDKVPEWMFLQWLPQLLSSLDSTKGVVLGPLLERIAKAYPAALQFPFQLSREMYQNNSNKPPQHIIDRLSSLLTFSPTMSALVDALTCLHYQPLSVLLYHLKKLKQDIEDNVDESITYGILKKESFLSAEDVNKVKGPSFKCNTKYEERIQQTIDTLKSDKTQALIELDKILKEVKREESANHKPENLLKNYSLFLDSFNQARHGDVEIPGQYTGQTRPIPEQHVMIAGFKGQVQIMPSKTHPMRITIIGNDAKERHYLVKFGEDLRQDQRIQQLFGVMNQILGTDPNTASRGLCVDTYAVVPLNTRSGLIAWVYDTVPLGNFIVKSEPQKYERAKHEFQAWICGTNTQSTHIGSIYSTVYRTYTRSDTIKNFTRIKNILPSDLLRRAVYRMASCSEAYMYLRSQMLTSYAVLCICQWLLGIGDRHLDNTLVSTKTGRLLGIDFDHAFDTAVSLPVPELMPFRMTHQIENLAAPLYLKGTLQETMVHTLQTLCNSHQVLLNTMNVFIQEPSINWLNNISKYNQEQDIEGAAEGNWYPQDKINLARRKLQGDHPSWIMLTEVETSHRNNPCLQYFVQLVQGVEEENIRSTMSKHGLTPREQVQCLLDQATDPHILGKSYIGWQPFV